MAGILSKGIKLGYSSSGTAPITYTNIENLQECPELGGTPDRVDVTCLADNNYKYIKGIKDYGELQFTFLYDNSTSASNFRVLKGLEDAGGIVYWQVEFPDQTKFAFSGEASVAPSAAAVNGALQFVLTVTLNSDIAITNPPAFNAVKKAD